MITGVHAVMFTQDAEALRAFLRDVLGLPSVDAGGGWLIFGLPPAELAAHPGEDAGATELYLMCDDIEATVAQLEAKGVELVVYQATFAVLRTARSLVSSAWWLRHAM